MQFDDNVVLGGDSGSAEYYQGALNRQKQD